MAQVMKNRKVEDYSYFVEYQTQWSDNDQYGHLNNSVYNHLIDTIINKYLIEHASLNVKGESSTIGLVVESHAAFFRSLSFPSRILLAMKVVSIGRSSVRYEVGVFGPFREEESSSSLATSSGTTARASQWKDHLSTQQVAMVGGFTHVFVDERTRKPVKELPKPLRMGLTAIYEENKSSQRDTVTQSKL
ncbi:hypothetical protein FRC18_006310 [Serendipita sp. 400]|nr:hypothetical protein FRC18_006310 [Serendipita sp. 400]